MPTSDYATGDFSTDPFGAPALRPRDQRPAVTPAPVRTAPTDAPAAPPSRPAPAAARPQPAPSPTAARPVAARPAATPTRPAAGRPTASRPAARPVTVSGGERIVAATDGSSLGNPGLAGACWYVSDRCWAATGTPRATNNQMELLAVRDLLLATATAGLAAVELEIQADSQYVIKALAGWEANGKKAPAWITGWRRKNWTTATGSPVANRELLEEIDALLRGRPVTFTWVKGHAGHALNSAADVRARAAATAAGQARGPVADGPGWTGR